MIEEVACPDCGGINRIEWRDGETKRRIACIHCAFTVFDEEPQKNARGEILYSKGRTYDDGSPVPVTLGFARDVGCRFEAIRQEKEVISG
jgi:hypothetical protein